MFWLQVLVKLLSDSEDPEAYSHFEIKWAQS